ncbi:DUF1592 domain-containing protein [Oligoflexus tunisiensis]|uniref:DUF1592 domain-containing protein n=1 Tax=Oligoflexus tunisiensis TaxID=708132 RepID=UPI00114D223C|nr:DUF1592 domain-containing protein [Oligoflexus tunisiensis]
MKIMVFTLLLGCLSIGCSKWEGKKKNLVAGTATQGGTGAAAEVELPLALRRITKSQFLNTVRLALSPELVSRTALPEDPTKDELIAIATRNSVFSLRDAELYNNAGWDIAGQFTESADMFSRRFDCACNDMNRACLAKGLDPIAKVLFRGRFDDADFYLKLFEDVTSNLTKEPSTTPTTTTPSCQGARTVLAAMIGSPRTFYYDYPLAFEVQGINDEQKKTLGLGVANQLSYFLWNSPPDAKLLSLAESGALADPKTRSEVIRSMVNDASRFNAGMKALFDDWLAMHAVEKIADTANAQADIAKAALVEYRALVDTSLKSTDFLNTFLTSTATVLDANLATVYGVAASATTLPATDRAGFLTRSAFLLRSGPGATSPTKRGHYIRGHFLCEDIPPPPPGLDLTTGVPQTEDKYEIIKARLNNNNCKSCHVLMDPLAIGLEGYGPNGQGVPFPNIASYQLSASVFEQPYSGGAELSQILAKNDKVLTCFAKNALRIGLGKMESVSEKKVIEEAVESFQNGENKALSELIFQLLSGIM